MFFEGSEKKIEVIIADSSLNIREFGQAFWADIVACANAEILSSISNEDCDAYLLSESSLFVWQDRFVMLTCGTTTLADAVMSFIEHVGEESIAFASYQRKNEYLSHLQSSSFQDDLKKIRKTIAGNAYRIGHLDSHHHYMFSTKRPFIAPDSDVTNELLMYHINGKAADYLRGVNQSKQGIRDLLALSELFPDFAVDDFLFEPFGYSINGIKGNEYFTIHITPQEKSSYVSLETNVNLANHSVDIYARLLSILNPGSWDVIGFNSPKNTQGFPAHLCLGSCSLATEQGYNIDFSHYQQLCHEVLIPEYL
ncbi:MULTISPECIES: adenosylmethionine decarboxylase [Shewanella]|uniref:adenosylmethionine decarboxylase n=1 Tax=Shewanella TaxID=22 RepID=UPI0006D6718A|nr:MULTISPECIES: adenosylmethionine decarboxylase [Shewanella]KPZ72597.1 Adenosylmethionine decarboxylase [Shewanella sp. P1-14-1]MBQ4889136.1 adenosylmethionine decarboxylase [Shewanella sp. MMG014]OBT11193.1 adenosylmethionine decarboxylase [Shewanella sp. UCD-FRSSP16_17]